MNTRKTMKSLLLLIPVFLLLALSSCKHDDLQIEKENENFRLATDFIKNNYEMTLFAAALEKTGIAEQLKGPGPFTVLVPDNNAFKEMGINNPSDFSKMDPDSLKSLVQRHILAERLLFKEVPFNGVDVRYRTLAGTAVFASVAGYPPGGEQYPTNNLYFDGSPVTRKDVFLANGVLHLLNKVMKNNPKSTVQDWLAKRPQYSIFVAGLKKFGFWDKLGTPGPYTVFAPNNKAFEAQGITTATIAEMNVDKYVGTRLFGAYILNNKHFFISDFEVFRINNSEQPFYRKVDNDTWYTTIGVSRDFYTAAVTCTMNLRTALDYPYENYRVVASGIPALSDNLTDNGLVHDLQGVWLLPQEALKQ